MNERNTQTAMIPNKKKMIIRADVQSIISSIFRKLEGAYLDVITLLGIVGEKKSYQRSYKQEPTRYEAEHRHFLLKDILPKQNVGHHCQRADCTKSHLISEVNSS